MIAATLGQGITMTGPALRWMLRIIRVCSARFPIRPYSSSRRCPCLVGPDHNAPIFCLACCGCIGLDLLAGAHGTRNHDVG